MKISYVFVRVVTFNFYLFSTENSYTFEQAAKYSQLSKSLNVSSAYGTH